MEGKVALAAVNGALDLVEALGPIIKDMVKQGQITPEQQQAVDDRVTSLRPGGVAFAGPEWQIVK